MPHPAPNSLVRGLATVLIPLSTACLLACQGDGGDDDGIDILKTVVVADSGTYPQDPAVISLPDSGVYGFWGYRTADLRNVWSLAGTRLSASGEVVSQPFEPLAPSIMVRRPVADTIPEGNGTTLAWIEQGPGIRESRIKVWRLASSGEHRPMTFVPPRADYIGTIAILSLADLGFVIACAYAESTQVRSLWIARFDLLGKPVGDPIHRSVFGGGLYVALAQPVLVARPGGGWLALWREIDGDKRAYTAAQPFDSEGAVAAQIQFRETEDPGCPSGEQDELRALAYPGGRILVLSGGKVSCSFLLDGNGAWIRSFEQPSPTAYVLGSAGACPVDTGKGTYLLAGGRRLSLLDSNLVEKAARFLPDPDADIQASTCTASGRPSVIVSSGRELRILLLDRFWR